jgi:hypothetical protein
VGLLLIQLFKRKTIQLILLILITSMASLIFLASLMSFLPDFVKLRSAYVSGKSLVVEGVVQNFRPAPAIGPAEESFLVDGVSFSYNALDDSPCFHNAPLHGGPVRGGLDVRIHYYEGCIQRIEVVHKAASQSSHSQP